MTSHRRRIVSQSLNILPRLVGQDVEIEVEGEEYGDDVILTIALTEREARELAEEIMKQVIP